MKKSVYYFQQRDRQESILKETNIFERVPGNGLWWNKEENQWEKYPHILQHQDSLKNLFSPIRQEVMSYFEEYDIAWWREDDDRYFPTGNLLSSQIHCLNHLFRIRKDPKAVLSIIKLNVRILLKFCRHLLTGMNMYLKIIKQKRLTVISLSNLHIIMLIY